MISHFLPILFLTLHGIGQSRMKVFVITFFETVSLTKTARFHYYQAYIYYSGSYDMRLEQKITNQAYKVYHTVRGLNGDQE